MQGICGNETNRSKENFSTLKSTNIPYRLHANSVLSFGCTSPQVQKPSNPGNRNRSKIDQKEKPLEKTKGALIMTEAKGDVFRYTKSKLDRNNQTKPESKVTFRRDLKFHWVEQFQVIEVYYHYPTRLKFV